VKTTEYVERGLHPTANVPNGDTEVGGGTFVGVAHALRSEPRRGNKKQLMSKLCHTDASELAIMPAHSNWSCRPLDHCLDNLQALRRRRVDAAKRTPAPGAAAKAARVARGRRRLSRGDRRSWRRRNLAGDWRELLGLSSWAGVAAAKHVLEIVPGLVLRSRDGDSSGVLA
jgi:hypothetical protein